MQISTQEGGWNTQ